MHSMGKKLMAYKKQYRSTKVPWQYIEDPQLEKWIGNQRALYKKNKLSDKHTELLNYINFVWSMRKAGSLMTMTMKKKIPTKM